MLTNEMVIKLIKLYDDDELTKRKRKEVKIVVDSLLEQLSKHYFGKHLIGLNLRLAINNEIRKFEEGHREVLDAIKNVIYNYDFAFRKDYIDYKDDFKSFFNGDLKNLVLNLIEVGFIGNSTLSSKLRELVS